MACWLDNEARSNQLRLHGDKVISVLFIISINFFLNSYVKIIKTACSLIKQH